MHEPVPSQSYYTRPQPAAQTPDYGAFWHGAKRLPSDIEPPVPTAVPAILVKKGGDAPPFWHKGRSFIDAMEELYQRVRSTTRNKR